MTRNPLRLLRLLRPLPLFRRLCLCPTGRFIAAHREANLRVGGVLATAVRPLPLAGRWPGLHHARARCRQRRERHRAVRCREGHARGAWLPRATWFPRATSAPLEVEEYSWSPDGKMLLVFTNTRPVWRLNTRGDYWVLDRAAHKLRKLGGADAKPSTLMFAKFSPDGRRVGVRPGEQPLRRGPRRPAPSRR